MKATHLAWTTINLPTRHTDPLKMPSHELSPCHGLWTLPQHLYLLWGAKKSPPLTQLLVNFCQCFTESDVLHHSLELQLLHHWLEALAMHHHGLQFLNIKGISSKWCLWRALKMTSDPTHPGLWSVQFFFFQVKDIGPYIPTQLNSRVISTPELFPYLNSTCQYLYILMYIFIVFTRIYFILLLTVGVDICMYACYLCNLWWLLLNVVVLL